MEARRWDDIVKSFKGKMTPFSNSTSAKLFFRNEDETKTFLDKN